MDVLVLIVLTLCCCGIVAAGVWIVAAALGSRSRD